MQDVLHAFREGDRREVGVVGVRAVAAVKVLDISEQAEKERVRE